MRRGGILTAAVAVLAGCAAPEPEFQSRRGLANIFSQGGGGGVEKSAIAPAPIVATEELVVEQDDGTVTLVSRSGRDLVRHLLSTLDADPGGPEARRFAEQLLSEATRAEFRERGRDPVDAIDMLRAQERDVRLLISRMPQGEFTPGVLMWPVAPGMFRLRPPLTRGLRLTFMDVVYERGSCRLRWVG